jgi:hypothetical protein
MTGRPHAEAQSRCLPSGTVSIDLRNVHETLTDRRLHSIFRWSGAGKEWDNDGDGKGNSGHCMRRTGAYAPQLNKDLGQIAKDHQLYFVSCTGDTTIDLLNFTNPDNQLNAIKEGTTFATLSIGGNDVQFGPIVKSCIYGAPGVNCDESKKKGLDILYGRDFYNRYNTVLSKILLEKFRFNSGTQFTKLYQTSYIQFFDDWTDECNSQKLHWWPGAHKMKKAVREEFNHMVHQLNEASHQRPDHERVTNEDLLPIGAPILDGHQEHGVDPYRLQI